MTPEVLQACTSCPKLALAASWLPAIVEAMTLYPIDTPSRRGMFLAQIGHESEGLQYTRELWGPTETQKRYEGRSDLGNTQPGDGKKFRGHGLIQITGRFNHAHVRDRLRDRFPDRDVPDFESTPEALALMEWAALSAADFWYEHDLNKWADIGDFDGVSDVINRGHKTSSIGDSNGYADRLAKYQKAQQEDLS